MKEINKLKKKIFSYKAKKQTNQHASSQWKTLFKIAQMSSMS